MKEADALDDALDDALEDALDDALEDALEDALDDALGDALDDALDDALEVNDFFECFVLEHAEVLQDCSPNCEYIFCSTDLDPPVAE